MRGTGVRVHWADLLWGPHNIPKASFVTWMAILGRLNTGDRLNLFGISQSPECVFCKDPCESHNHLFFNCPFSSKIWASILSKLDVSWPIVEWPDITKHMALSVRGKSIKAIIIKLAFTCTVYHVWIARNNRVFRKDNVPEEIVLKSIVDMIRFRVMSMTNLARHTNDGWFLHTWRIPASILKTPQIQLSVGSSAQVG